MSGQCLPTFVIHSTTSEWFLQIPWITSMPATSGTLSPHVLPAMDLQRMLKAHSRYLYHLHYTHQFHQRIPYISTDIYRAHILIEKKTVSATD